MRGRAWIGCRAAKELAAVAAAEAMLAAKAAAGPPADTVDLLA